MNQFSDVGSEVLSFNNIKMAKAESSHLSYRNRMSKCNEVISEDQEVQQEKKMEVRSLKKQRTTMINLVDVVSKYDTHFADVEKLNFNLFDLNKTLQRPRTLPFTVVYIL